MILDEIVAYKKQEVARDKEIIPVQQVLQLVDQAEFPRDFYQILKDWEQKPAIIAEIKKASPSCGVIRPDFDTEGIARIYTKAGAAALSVLTDHRFFQGEKEFLPRVRRVSSLPLLRKDFIIDEYQIYEARALGADAVLLIARILDRYQIAKFLATVRELGMVALVEIHSEQELEGVLDVGTEIVGINNRDLDNFTTNLEKTLSLRELIPKDRLVVSESGIKTKADVRLLKKAGVDALLIGETFMRQDDIAAKVRELREAVSEEGDERVGAC